MGLRRRLLTACGYSLVVPGGVCGVVPWAIQRWGTPPWTVAAPWSVAAGWTALGLGAALYLWCAWDFVSRGEGTPNPLDPPRRLVVAGPYRLVRNPMYLAVWLALLGHCLRWPAVPMVGLFVGSVVFVLAFVLGYEEPALTRRFGDAYTRYRTQVPRFLPRWRGTPS